MRKVSLLVYISSKRLKYTNGGCYAGCLLVFHFVSFGEWAYRLIILEWMQNCRSTNLGFGRKMIVIFVCGLEMNPSRLRECKLSKMGM